MNKAIKQTILVFLCFSMLSNLLAKSINKTTSPIKDKTNIYVVNYIKNKKVKGQIRKFYKSLEGNFINLDVSYKEFKKDTFYKNFRLKGLSFLGSFMKNNNKHIVMIFYQKSENEKISILSQKINSNAFRKSDVSSRKFSKENVYEEVISKSLKMLGELVVINTKNRII